VFLRVSAGAGGVQVRCYCTACWRAGPALAHAVVAEADVPVVDGERKLIEDARRAAWARWS
jgi:hypothetical protein